jgi:hypothetical protein
MKKEIVIQGKVFIKPEKKAKGKSKKKKQQREQPKSIVRL